MSQLQINTTQNVKIDFTVATVGERMLAFILDFLVFIAYWVFIYIFLEAGRLYDNAQDGFEIKAIHFLLNIPMIFYTLTLESLFQGQTIGKKIMKIRVVKLDGYQTTFLDFLIRWFFRMIDIYLFTTLLIFFNSSLDLIFLCMMFGPIVGFLFLVISKKTQRIGDIVAGTGVVSLKNKINISHTILEEISQDYVPTYPAVIKLSDNDARIIKETFALVRKNRDYSVLIKLRSKIEEVTGIKNQERNDAVFISKILKDYNYYTQNM
ncbi:MAG: RDD family protein [Flavobacteriaceae bacterium]|nr:RDD family protein [Flavobacteriaceae bacterium]